MTILCLINKTQPPWRLITMTYAAFVYLMAVISPGPNFILVSRYSSLGALRSGFAVTLGICTVSGFFLLFHYWV